MTYRSRVSRARDPYPTEASFSSRAKQELNLGSTERDVYGMTVTLREQATGETRAIAETGMTAMNALRVILELADSWEGEWRVVACSTPATIFTDLAGARFSARGDSSVRNNRAFIDPYQVERVYLARVGWLDMLSLVSGALPAVEARHR